MPLSFFEDMPPGWHTALDDDGKQYYYNEIEGVSTWVRPSLSPMPGA